MRWSGLAGCSVLLLASQVLVACGDDETNTPIGGAGSSVGGSSAGSGGKGSAGSNSKAGSGGDAAGKDTGGTDAGGTDTGGTGGMDTAGTAGTGGMAPMPECTKDLDCPDDFNGCTDEKCVDGKCSNVANKAACTDDNPCTDDVCDAGKCKSTNNTATCDDGNTCTDADKCVEGACKGTNNTKDCDDLNSCTKGQDKCMNGVCTGTRDTATCPVCTFDGNLIKNCDFSKMLTDWATDIAFEGGVATQAVVNERDTLTTTEGGANLYCIQPRQEPLTLKQGYKYKFGLVAGSDVERDAAIALTQNYGPKYQVYSLGDSDAGGFKAHLKPEMQPFNFSFFMKEADDAKVKLEIKIGGKDAKNSKTYFDDVYLQEVKCALPADCDDGNVCTDDACDAATGKCTWTNHVGSCTDDLESCTEDVCDAGVCKHNAAADNAACDPDANDCTLDVCKTGKCSHPRDLASTDPLCKCTKDEDCNDGKECTDDKCDVPTGVCTSTNDDTNTCSDGMECTSADKCTAGVCGGTAICTACDVAGNLVQNCAFTTDLTSWSTDLVNNGGGATQSVEGGMLKVAITAGGQFNYSVQPHQSGIVLVTSTNYVLTFNAKASVARTMGVSVTQDGGLYTSYTMAPAVNLTTGLQQYKIPFSFTATPPDEKVKVEFDLGGAADNAAANTVWIDNVSLVGTPK